MDVAPASDLVSIYQRNLNGNYQIRLDFLDLQESSPPLLIGLDIRPGGAIFPSHLSHFDIDWDLLIDLSDGEQPRLLNDLMVVQPGINISVEVNLEFDWVILSIPNSDLPGEPARYSLQVNVLCNKESMEICDSSRVVFPGLPSRNQVDVGFIFSDVLLADTPLQLLRRWDGAHSGPFGQRHGLKHLLEIFRRTNIPLVLCGFGDPEWSLIDLVEQRDWLLWLNQRAMMSFAEFNFSLDGLLTIPEADQVNNEGLSIALRKALISHSMDDYSLEFLGGSLPNSGWGDLAFGDKASRYLASRPWITLVPTKQVLRALELTERNKTISPLIIIAPELFKWLIYHDNGASCRQSSISQGDATCFLHNRFFFIRINPKTGYPEIILNHTASGLVNWLDEPGAGREQSLITSFSGHNFSPMIIQENEIVLKNQNGANIWKYHLSDQSLHIDLNSTLQSTISLDFHPQNLTNPHTAERLSTSNNAANWSWQTTNCFSTLISSSGLSVINKFTGSDLILVPEDPDISYPSNFNIPFGVYRISFSPSAIIQIEMTEQCK